ncbi:MAG: hypothetical protein ACO396_01160 [Phycisphaerales bacterium]
MTVGQEGEKAGGISLARERHASNCARVSSSESPENFARNALATSNATTFSRTTLAAATAQTSERS